VRLVIQALLQGLANRITQGQRMKNEAAEALERQRHETVQAREESKRAREDLAAAQVKKGRAQATCGRRAGVAAEKIGCGEYPPGRLSRQPLRPLTEFCCFLPGPPLCSKSWRKKSGLTTRSAAAKMRWSASDARGPTCRPSMT